DSQREGLRLAHAKLNVRSRKTRPESYARIRSTKSEFCCIAIPPRQALERPLPNRVDALGHAQRLRWL
ncbi:MAG: hypothetical protein AAFP04_16080, partial [Myxococcota bacterium]